jgi:hypothetical protein
LFFLAARAWRTYGLHFAVLGQQALEGEQLKTARGFIYSECEDWTSFCKPLPGFVRGSFAMASHDLSALGSDMRMADQLLPTRFSALKYGSAARLRFCR